MHNRFPDSSVIGAASCVSFTPEGACSCGINAAALYGGRIAVGIIGEIARHPMKYKSAVSEALCRLGPGLRPDNTVCFLLNPAGTYGEELVLDTIAEALEGTDIPVVGGAASSSEILRGEVSLNGTVLSDASVFALIHLDKGRLHVFLENIFAPIKGSTFTVTSVDAGNCTVCQLDGHPAAEVLRRSLRVPLSNLEEELTLHPLGRVAGKELFIDEVKGVDPDKSVHTFCRVFNMTPLTLLQLRDYRQTFAETVARVKAELPGAAFGIVVNCYRRTVMFEEKGWMPEFVAELSSCLGHFIGLSSFGEQLDTYQLSLSMLILAFSDEP